MTDKQRAAKLETALRALEQTRDGYKQSPNGPRWKVAMPAIRAVLADLKRPAVPQLGPLVQDGLPVLLFAPTHDTDGLFATTGSHYPAFDSEFGQIGRWVIAPEAFTVTRDSSAQGGDAFYATGASGLKYWFGHLGTAPKVGAKFRKGQRVGQIASIARPHVHLGIDARPLIGHDLRWGKNGNGPDYTWGSPTIGPQLTKALGA